MAGGKYNWWTEDETKKVLDEYGKKDIEILARELERTKGSVVSKYYREINKQLEKDNKNETKRFEKINMEYKKVDKCPICGSKRVNTVKTFIHPNCISVNYCLNCFHEFTGSGKILTPLWDGTARA